MESWGAEGDMGAEEQRQVLREDHETENLRGGSEKGDLERTGQRVKVRKQSFMGSRKWTDPGSERSKALSPALKS